MPDGSAIDHRSPRGTPPSRPGPSTAGGVATLLAGVLAAMPAAGVDPALFPPSYSVSDAMFIAGKHVPRSVEEFYFFAVEPYQPTPALAAELRDLLASAEREHGYLGIAGPHARQNLEVVLGAFAGAADYSHATIIYLGPDEQKAKLEALVRPTGATLHFKPYPDYQ